MHTRVTPFAPVVSRLLERRAAHREAVRGEQRLARALAGDFGRGVQADVMAAQEREAKHRTAA